MSKPSFCLSRHSHPSQSEASYCNWLYARVQNGEILGYKLYPSVPLRINGQNWKSWQVDFMVEERDGTISFHESKGWNRSDDSFRLKRDVFLICYPHIKLYVNKQLWTGKPVRKSVKWRMSDIVKKNKRAAESRKRMQRARKFGTIKTWLK